MSRTLWLRWAFALSGLVAILSGALILYRWPATVTIAVGPENSPLVSYTREIRDALEAARSPYRLRIIATAGSSASSKVLDERKADLAIVRSDDETSQFARSLVLLQQKTFFAIGRKVSPEKPGAADSKPPANAAAGDTKSAGNTVGTPVAIPAEASKPPDTKPAPVKKTKDAEHEKEENNFLEDIGKLRGGILQRRGSHDLPAVKLLLEHYGMDTRTKTLLTMNRKEAEEAFRTNRIDYLIVVAHPSELAIRQLIRSTRKVLGDKFVIIGPPSAKGLAYQLKTMQPSSLPAGVFGGNPPLPASDLESVAVTYEMVATTRMSERKAANITKTLKDLRALLRGSDDGEFAIEMPSNEEARRYLPHPGSVAVSNGEVKTILDTYSDIIWLALFGMGLVGSAISSLMSWLGLGKGRKLEVT
jgi:TRAP-type uncharacterized transport system substrate-binding protein